MARILLEKSYEAVLDAGVNPVNLKGKRVGVFVGCYISDAENDIYSRLDNHGLMGSGVIRTMLANRISYFFDIHGPSYMIDTGCSSSMHALHQACQAIKNGECESAIVGGCNLCRKTDVSLQLYLMGALSSEKFRCMCFDEEGDGYCRSESICAVFLQKSCEARRIYAEVVHTKCNNDGFKMEGPTFPSGVMQRKLIDEFYAECGVDKKLIFWIESHGTGTKAGDPQEAYSMEAFCDSERKSPVYVGSIKSNIGHTEATSGLCAVIKGIIAMEYSKIPPNINYRKPRPEIKPLSDGRMKIITDELPWEGGFMAINNFGFGGSNVHVLLRSVSSVGKKTDDIPRIITVSGRTKAAVTAILNYVETQSPLDAEFVALIHGIFNNEIHQHLFRGYSVVGKNIMDVVSTSGSKRPVWFIFSGMGSQWTAMAKPMMKIPSFADAIQRCHDTLQKENFDLKRVLLDDDPSIQKRLLNCFVGITAIQIALIDTLRVLNIVPDGIIGHSMGELTAAYCDGCLTLEQCMLCSYYRGVCTSESNVIKGLMLSIGLSFNELEKRCPPGAVIATRNSPKNYTVSGPLEVMQEFKAQLVAEGVFAKDVYSENVPYHSPYIKHCADLLLQHTKKVITCPVKRSKRWISSSIMEKDWTDQNDLWKFASPEYFANNLISTLYFEEAVLHIPDDAIIIEVAPHSIITPILKQFETKSFNSNFSLMNKFHADNFIFFQMTLGKLFGKGLNLNLESLYPPVNFPVSKGTAMIAPLIQWDHAVNWPVSYMAKEKPFLTADRRFHISVDFNNYRFLKDHVVDGRNLFPGTGFLVLAWQTFAMIYGKDYREFSVLFRKIHFKKAVHLYNNKTTELTAVVHKGTGFFEVSDEDESICTGYIFKLDQAGNSNDYHYINPSKKISVQDDGQILKSADIYKELRIRGYRYGPYFQNIISSNIKCSEYYVNRNNNWITFLDSLLQCAVLCKERILYIPESIEKIVIDIAKYNEIVNDREEKIPVNFSHSCDLVSSHGVQFKGFSVVPMNRRKCHLQPVLQKQNFVPYFHSQALPTKHIVNILVNIIIENLVTSKVKAVELFTKVDSRVRNKSSVVPLSLIMDDVFKSVPCELSATIYTDESSASELEESLKNSLISVQRTLELSLPLDQSKLVTIASYVLENEKIIENLYDNTAENGFIIVRQEEKFDLPKCNNLRLCCNYVNDEGDRILLYHKVSLKYQSSCFFRISGKDFKWVTDLQNFIKTNSENRIILLVENEPNNGILGFYKCIRKEIAGHNMRCIFILDNENTLPSDTKSFYKEQLLNDLAINVYKNKCWGCYNFLPLQNENRVAAEHSFLSVKNKGDLNSMIWLEGPLKLKYKENNSDEPILVCYSALNFKDILLSSGLLINETSAIDDTWKSYIGTEFSGKLMNGKRVCGIARNGCIATMVSRSNCQILEVPDDWSLEDAATVPVVYVTVVWALLKKAEMREGESILIHSGAGGVGLAAINIAIRYKCDIFTTVGTEEKAQFLKENYPYLKASHICSSRNESFEQTIMNETNGRGIDIVLNSYVGNMREASVRCLSDKGRFLELGKIDISENLVGFKNFNNEVSFHSIPLDVTFNDRERFSECMKLLQKAITDGLVKPLKRTVFPMNQAGQAFKHLSTGKHIGKVLIKIQSEEECIAEQSPSPNVPPMIAAIPQFICSDNYSAIICGGLGGMGLELVYWMIYRGLRNVVICSRRGITSGYQKLCLYRWKSFGVNVVISRADISTEDGVKEIIATANSLAPVLAIFNLTLVMRDAQFENQTEGNFREASDSKGTASILFDRLSRKLCPRLRYFVVFSSVACGYGNTGQTYYGYANSVMERVCEKRRADGLPALSIEWGGVAEAGALEQYSDQHTIQGTLLQPIRSCLGLMNQFLHQSETIVSSFVFADKTSNVESAEDVTVCGTIRNILGIKDLQSINRNTKLQELGLDSIATAEVKQLLEKKCDVYLTTREIISSSIVDVMNMDKSKSKLPQDIPKNLSKEDECII